MIALSLLLSAAALVVTTGPEVSRLRLRESSTTSAAARGRLLPQRWRAIPQRWRALLAGLGPQPDRNDDPLALAGAWDLLAACLRSGMPVPIAVRAVGEGLDGAAGPALRRTADLLRLGASPDQAWQPALDCAATVRLARAARRSGRSGSALAESLTRLAIDERARASEQSEARAQRAGVLIAGPLGLCFLPAFIAIGVLPVVIGLAAGVLRQW